MIMKRVRISMLVIVVGLFYAQKSLSAMEARKDPSVVKPLIDLVLTRGSTESKSPTHGLPTSLLLRYNQKKSSPLRTISTAEEIEKEALEEERLALELLEQEKAEQKRRDQEWFTQMSTRPFYFDTSDEKLYSLMCVENKWIIYNDTNCDFHCTWYRCTVGHAFATLEELLEHLFTVHLKLPERLPAFEARYLSMLKETL